MLALEKASCIMRLFLLTFFVSLFTALNAQTDLYPDWECDAFTGINTAIVFSENYQWLGTSAGVIRINIETGEQYVYDHSNSILDDPYIFSIYADRENRIWFTNRSGLFVIEDLDLRKMRDDRLWSCSFTEKPDGSVLIAKSWAIMTYKDEEWSIEGDLDEFGVRECFKIKYYEETDQLVRLIRSSWDLFLSIDGPDGNITHSSVTSNLPQGDHKYADFEFDANGDLWVANRFGLYRLVEDEWWIYYAVNSGLEAYNYYSIHLDNEGRLNCLGSWGNRHFVGVYENEVWTSVEITAFEGDRLTRFPSTLKNDKWYLSHWGKGVFTLENDQPILLAGTASAKPNNYIFCLERDTENRVWMTGRTQNWTAPFSRGPVYYRNNKYEELAPYPFTKEDYVYVYDMYPTPDGGVAMVGREGLTVHDGNSFWSIPCDSTIFTNDWLENVFVASNGDIWVHERYTKIQHYNGNSWKPYWDGSHGLEIDYRCEFAENPIDGTIWLSGDNGVSWFDGEQWHVVSGQHSNRARELHFDANGQCWAPSNYGLLKINEDGIEVVDSSNSSLIRTRCTQMSIAPNGDFWILSDSLLYAWNGDEITDSIQLGKGAVPFPYYWFDPILDFTFDAKGQIFIAIPNHGVFRKQIYPVEDQKNQELLTINTFESYPNPVVASAQLQIQLEEPLQCASLQLEWLDLSGRTVELQRTDPLYGEQIEVEVPSLPPGIYLLRINGSSSKKIFISAP